MLKRDIKLANLQDTLMTSMSAITSSLNDLLGNQNAKVHISPRSIASKLIDATALIGHVTKELSFKRRDQIKPFLHNDCKQACSQSNEVDTLLFGSDLAGKVQQLKQASKVVQTITPTERFTTNNSRFQPNNYRPLPNQRPFFIPAREELISSQETRVSITSKAALPQEEIFKELEGVKVTGFSLLVQSKLIPFYKLKSVHFR